jgi:hypothetical protein
MNRFLYAHANPATLIDPDGHRPLETTSGTGYTTVQPQDDPLDCSGTRCYSYAHKQVTSSGTGSSLPPGYAEPPHEAPEGYHWVPGANWKPALVPISCTIDTGGYFQGDCVDEKALGDALFVSAGIGGAIIIGSGAAAICVLHCTAAGLALGARVAATPLGTAVATNWQALKDRLTSLQGLQSSPAVEAWRSLGASGVRILQSGGRTISDSTARALNRYFETTVARRDWGRALEALKEAHGLPPSFHGKIDEFGNLLDKSGQVIGNIFQWLP